MKRLITSILAALSLLLVPAVAVAETPEPANPWWLDVSVPTSPTTKKNLALEYKILATNAESTFNVVLKQNGSQVGEQAVTKPYGSNGVFSVTMSTPGTYTFEVIVTDAFEQTQSETRTVKLNAPTVVTTATVESNGSVSNGTGSSAANRTARNGGVVSDIAATTSNNGSVQAATDESKNEKKESKSAAKKDDDNQLLIWWVVAGLIAVGVTYYWFFHRIGKGPFATS